MFLLNCCFIFQNIWIQWWMQWIVVLVEQIFELEGGWCSPNNSGNDSPGFHSCKSWGIFPISNRNVIMIGDLVCINKSLVGPLLILDGIYSSLFVHDYCETKKFKVFSHNISYTRSSWKSGTFDAFYGEMRNYVHTCLSIQNAKFSNDLFHFHYVSIYWKYLKYLAYLQKKI